MKIKVFQKCDLIKLQLTEKEIQLVKDYQEKFPQLLQYHDEQGFVVDGEILCNELEINDNFNTWLIGETRHDSKGKLKWQGKLIKYRCIKTLIIQAIGIPQTVNSHKKKLKK